MNADFQDFKKQKPDFFKSGSKIDDLVKSLILVTPAKAGVQNILEGLDSGFRRNDMIYGNSTFQEFIMIFYPYFLRSSASH